LVEIVQEINYVLFYLLMNKENLASMLTRIHFCNITQLEDKNEWDNMKKSFMELEEHQFLAKLHEFGFLDKDGS